MDTQPTKPTIRMTTEEIWSFVTEAPVGILMTLRRDGTPIGLPTWFTCIDGVIYLNTRGKKLARVRNDPRASFLVESGQRWAELKAVHLTGVADIPVLPPALVERITAEHTRKYAALTTAASDMPADTSAVYASGHAIVRFTPGDRILNWDNAKLGL